MHIDPLDPAAALPGVKHGRVGERGNRRIEISIFHHIAGVLAAQFQAQPGKGARCRRFHGTPAADRAGEVDEVEGSLGNQLRGGVMIEKHILKDIRWHTDRVKSLRHPLAYQQGLRRVLQHHAVARDQSRSHAIDRRHVGVVPRGHHQHHAVWHTLDIALSGGVFAHLDSSQSVLGNGCHVTTTLLETTEFTAIAHWAAHHARQFRHHFVIHLAHGGNACHDQIDTFLYRSRSPFRLRCTRARGGLSCGLAGQRFALGKQRAINW